jgi:outer membrane protein assembly factor BamB
LRYAAAALVLAFALAVVALHGHERRRGGLSLSRQARAQPHLRRALHPVRERAAADWPTYGFDDARRHAAPFALRPPFRVLWKQGGDWSFYEFPPIVVGGRLYVAMNQGLVMALDAASGRVIWRHPLGRCTASSPAVAEGVLVIGALGPSRNCHANVPSYVVGLDARDGRTLWRHRTGLVESSPLAVGRTVIYGSSDGRVDALAVTDGRIHWSVRTNGPVKAGAARSGPTVYIGSYDGSLYAIDAGTGAVRWREPAGAPFYATPAVASGRVVAATTDGVVHAFAAGSGSPLWSTRIGRFAYSAAAIAQGRVYVGSYDHRLYALDLATGRVLWTHTSPGPVSGAPTVLGGLVYFSSCGSCSDYESNPDARRTFAIDARTGRLVWKFPDGEYSPIVTDGIRVYLTGFTVLYGLAPVFKSKKG